MPCIWPRFIAGSGASEIRPRTSSNASSLGSLGLSPHLQDHDIHDNEVDRDDDDDDDDLIDYDKIIDFPFFFQVIQTESPILERFLSPPHSFSPASAGQEHLVGEWHLVEMLWVG